MSNYFQKNQKDLFNLVLLKLVVDEDAPKEMKRKIEEYRNCEKTV